MRRVIFTLAVMALILSVTGCGSEEAGQPETTLAPPTSAETTTTSEAVTTSEATTSTSLATTTTEATTTTGETTTTVRETTTTTLWGEPFDEMAPPAGAILAVFGVAHDDVLNVRELPGIDKPIVTTLDPLADDVVSLGHGWMLSQSIWWQVEANGVTGWASSRYLWYLGPTDDLTSLVVTRLGDQIPAAENMTDLGLLVADTLASDDPPSKITLTIPPTIGDLGNVTYDVAGLGDDALWGYRLFVFGEPIEEGFSLKSVEATEFCIRGGGTDGPCP